MNELITVLKVMADFNGQNHIELARKYNLPSNTVYRIISHAVRVAIVQGLSEGEEKSIALLWAGRASQLGSLQGSLAVLKAAEKAINSDSHHHAHFALVALHSNGQATAQGSSSAAPSTDQAESQPYTQDHKSDLPAFAALQTTLLDLPTNTSMSPFTIFLGRLVEHLGAEISAKLVREFAGQSIQFPITQDYTDSNDTSTGPEFKRKVSSRMTIFVSGIEYDVSHLPEAAVSEVITVSLANLKHPDLNDFGFPALVPVLGAGYVRPQAKSKTHSLPNEPHHSSVQTSASSAAQLPSADRLPDCSSQVSPQCATQPELTHSTVPLKIESQLPDLSGS